LKTGTLFGFSIVPQPLESFILLILAPFLFSLGIKMSGEDYVGNLKYLAIFFACFLGLSSATYLIQNTFGGSFFLPVVSIIAGIAGVVCALEFHCQKAYSPYSKNPIAVLSVFISSQLLVLAGAAPYTDIAFLFVISLAFFALVLLINISVDPFKCFKSIGRWFLK